MRPASGSASPRSATRRSTSSWGQVARCRGRGRLRFPRRAQADGEERRTRAGGRAARATTRIDGRSRAAAGRGHVVALLAAEVEGQVDTLFVDEAGQLALADALAVGTAATEPDPARRPAPARPGLAGRAPAGRRRPCSSTCSAGTTTVPPGIGVFLQQTWRMRPDVARFISDSVLRGPARAERPSCAERSTPWANGLRFAPDRPRRDTGSQSVRRPSAIAAEIERLLVGTFTDAEAAPGSSCRRHRGRRAVQRPGAAACASALPDGRPVGTVDKFQGQEAAVVFYSMASSSGEDVPRGLEFLFSRNRLNVAISRAQVPRVPRREPAAARDATPHDRADAARERALPLRRIGQSASTR